MMDYKLLFYYLSAGAKEWEKNFHKIPRKILKGHQLLIHACAINKIKPPTDISMLVRMLMQPIEKWGIEQMTNVLPGNAQVISANYGVTEEAEDFLSYYKHPEEEQNAVMEKILAYCRAQNLQDEYVNIRMFLSNPAYAVVSAVELAKFRRRISHVELAGFFMMCYEEVSYIANFKKCPNCGWTLTEQNGAWRCNKDHTCRQLSNFTNVKFFSFDQEKVYRMTSGIQKYTLLPGMAEEKIATRLRKKGYSIIIYPEVDQDDIAIEFDYQTIYVDVKDYRNPYTLAHYLIDKNPPSTSWYVIPSYHEEIFPMYKQIVEQYLRESNLTYTIIMENELIKKLEAFQDVEIL